MFINKPVDYDYTEYRTQLLNDVADLKIVLLGMEHLFGFSEEEINSTVESRMADYMAYIGEKSNDQ